MTAVPGFMFVDHVAISVPLGALEGQVSAYEMLGFKVCHREEVPAPHLVREVLLKIGDGPNLLQLIEPTSPDSPVAKSIEKRGGRGGVEHVAFRVKSAKAAFDYLKAGGFRMTSEAPGPGSRGTTMFFIHPKSREDSPFGVLFEIVEDPS
jgi:methylmalonyl-CoA/ethylmalonyl-CoA epimerase